MKKFVLKVLLFFTCVVVMDFAFGRFFSYMRAHAKGGSTANCEYIANRCQDDIIILGSSRATHHYVPQIIEDSLGMSCYNCGEEGNGIVLAYGRFKQIVSRHRPNLVVYEVTPGYDYSYLEPDVKYLGYLKPYYGQSFIRDIVNDFGGSLISIKMLSKMYQNSDRLLPNLVDNIILRDNFKGYEPLYGLKSTPIQLQKDTKISMWDSHKLQYLERLISDAGKYGIPICFVVSPRCEQGNDMTQFSPAISLCNKYNVPFINLKNCKGIFDQPSLFQDDYHLNNDGAVQYSSLFVEEIKRILE